MIIKQVYEFTLELSVEVMAISRDLSLIDRLNYSNITNRVSEQDL